MFLVKVIINFNLPYAHGLKGRRKILNSLKDKLKKLNISLLDISSEYPKEGQFLIAFVTLNVNKKINKIEDTIYNSFPEIDFDLEVDIL